MIAALSLFLIVAISVLLVRVGALALEMTGLSREIAAFQALSAFSGVGFTTSEAEKITGHPLRRRIASILIRTGSIGIGTAITALVLTFLGSDGENSALKITIIGVGGVILLVVSRSRRVQVLTEPLLKRLLARYTDLTLYDYSNLLHLYDGSYNVREIITKQDGWLTKAPLRDLNLIGEGVLVLGVLSGQEYVGAPPMDRQLVAGDRIILYGHTERLAEIAERRGDDAAAHEEGKAEKQAQLEEGEKKLDRT